MRGKRLLLAALCCAAACGHKLTLADKEEARRGRLELQSVMDMVSSRELPPVAFEPGSDELLESSRPLLDKIAGVLLKHDHLKLIVEGHTDDTGSARRNEELSLRRAGAVKQYLAEKGVYPDSIRVYGYGSLRPVVKGTDEAARAMNRRVEFKITTRDWASVF